jgi:hypothetical protein
MPNSNLKSNEPLQIRRVLMVRVGHLLCQEFRFFPFVGAPRDSWKLHAYFLRPEHTAIHVRDSRLESFRKKFLLHCAIMKDLHQPDPSIETDRNYNDTVPLPTQQQPAMSLHDFSCTCSSDVCFTQSVLTAS